MRQIRALGLCVLASLAFGAATTASASAALPEFSGSFPKAFTLKSKSSMLETVGKTKIKCASDTGEGEATASQTLFVSMTLAGCKKGTVACSAMVFGRTYPSLIGYIDAAKDEVGIALQGGTPAGTVMAATTCGSHRLSVVADHGVVGKVTPVNKAVAPSEHFTLKFSQKEGKEKLTGFEGGETETWLCVVDAGPYEECGFASSEELTFAEEVQIKA
jgi:hypothetical protein